MMYKELPEASEYSREKYAAAVKLLAELGFSSFEINPDAAMLANALGAPLNLKINDTPSISREYVGSDDICEIFRIRISALPTLPFFGLMFVPKSTNARIPLIIAAHGHLGTPELMYGMHGKNGYSNIIRRLLSRGVAVFCPQLLMWNYGFNPAKPHYATPYNRPQLDRMLKAHDGSITALEVFCILRSIDAFSTIRSLDISKLSVCGMSYGAFMTMRAMAVDKRIKRGYFMSCFNGGIDLRFPEWNFRNGFETMRDGEIAALCAPRPIYIEVGKHDDIFPLSGALREVQNTYRTYKLLGAEENFNFGIWNGGHLVNPEDDGIDFLLSDK